MKVSTREYVDYNCIDDIYDELIALYDESESKGFQVGEAIYTQVPFFADERLFVTDKIQNRIKEYLFCKTFSTPIYRSVQETPAQIVDDFLVIDEEFKACKKHNNKDKE